MKRFYFSLEALLQKRNREEEYIKQEVSQKNSEIYDQQQQFEILQKQLTDMQKEQKHKRADVLNITDLKYSVSYRNKLKNDILKKGQDIQLLQKQLMDIKKRLIKAKQNKRAIEMIREKKYSEWFIENKRKEQGFIDDISQQRYIRKHKSEVRSSMV